VDIVVEGKIDPEGGMREVLETILRLNSLQNGLLRISSSDRTLSGRIAFSQNGYILGGKLDDPGEIGYLAIRKLLSVKEGNYAVLDSGRTHVPEVNQTLWISVEQILPSLSNLPESPDQFIEGDLSALAGQARTKTGHINLYSKEWKDHAEPATADLDSKARKFDRVSWRTTVMLLWCIVILSVTTVVVQFWDRISPHIPKFHNPLAPSAPPPSVSEPTRKSSHRAKRR
jgi:hypothetical protein